ncbi:unnamed protein product [Anisakis simplex]|uniref:Activin_recp domain-containing protein n=1 Tax=Anisakis simplex TaxID=6269 RepID=A0A0M3KAI5_ANISI|nr:unnamed protein product [Anisakis simplex]
MYGCVRTDVPIANFKMNAEICCCAADLCNCKKLTGDQCKKGDPGDKTPLTPAPQNPTGTTTSRPHRGNPSTFTPHNAAGTTTSGASYECRPSTFVMLLFASAFIKTNYDLYLRH